MSNETTTTTKALAPIEDGPRDYAMLPDRHEWSVLQAMAKTAGNTRFFGNLGGEAGILSIMLYARELNIPPMAAIMGGFHNIQGRVEMSARLMTMRIRQGGHILKLKHLDHERCTVYGKRTDTGEDMDATYTFQEAKEAGLVKQDGNWMKFRQDMLWARAISRLARRLFPDVIGTAYVEGEILEMIPTRSETKVSPETTQIVSPDFEDAQEDRPDFESMLPEDIDRDQLERYVKTCAAHFGQDPEQFKAAIVTNGQMEDFLKAFQTWAAKQAGQSMPQKENGPQRPQEPAHAPENKEDSDPWQAFRQEFINLRNAGYSTWLFKNRDRLAQAPEPILQEAREKWSKLYPANKWPLDSPAPDHEETAPMFPEGEDGPVDIDTGEILQVACPERDGRDVPVEDCDACDMRDRCPSWEG